MMPGHLGSPHGDRPLRPSIPSNQRKSPADNAGMTSTNLSACGRFVVIDGLHLDRNVFEALTRWAADHELRIQDAIQLALCTFRDVMPTGPTGLLTMPSEREDERRIHLLGIPNRVDSDKGTLGLGFHHVETQATKLRAELRDVLEVAGGLPDM